jgi:hypothetical protein
MVEVGVADEDRIGLLDLARHDASRPIARAALKIGVEQEHLTTVDELVIRRRKPPQHDLTGVAQQRPTHGSRHRAPASLRICAGGLRLRADDKPDRGHGKQLQPPITVRHGISPSSITSARTFFAPLLALHNAGG